MPAAPENQAIGKLCRVVYETEGKGKYVGCSSVGRAPDRGSGGRGFKSRQSPHDSEGKQQSRQPVTLEIAGPAPVGVAIMPQ